MKITAIIPTLWLSEVLKRSCDELRHNNAVEEVIVINNRKNFKNIEFAEYGELAHAGELEYHGRVMQTEKFGKFLVVTPPHNLYVSESWNLGAFLAKTETLCLLNDDIVVDPKAFEFIEAAMNPKVGIIGLHPGCYSNLEHSDKVMPLKRLASPIHNLPFAFGCCMFFLKSKYPEIPSNIRIYFNDNYLFAKIPGQHYCYVGAKVRGSVSKSVGSKEINHEVQIIVKEDEKAFKELLEQGAFHG
jgi:hypothetical protein